MNRNSQRYVNIGIHQSGIKIKLTIKLYYLNMNINSPTHKYILTLWILIWEKQKN